MIKIVTLLLILIFLISTISAYAASSPLVAQQKADYSAITPSGKNEKMMLYNANCGVCHGQGKRGQQATQIGKAINKNIGGMGSLKFLSSEQIRAISSF